MSKIVQFPKEKKEHIYKEDECAGCHKEMTEKMIEQRVQLPLRDTVRHIALCKGCLKEAQNFGVLL